MIIRRLALVAFLIALTGCDPLTSAEHESLRRWYLCDECVDGELDSVLALGERPLKALEAALLRGPPRDRLRNFRLQAEGMYDDAEPGGIGRAAYVDGIVKNYIASYQRRAAVALSRIGTPKARTILIEALRREPGYREDVRRTLGQTIGVIVTKQVGDSQHAQQGSFIVVNPAVLVRDSTNGQALRGIPVRFRVDSGTGQVFDSLRRTDTNGRVTARWRLGLQDSVAVLRATAAGRSVRFTAFGHPSGPRLVFLTQPSDGTAGQPITPPVRVAVQDPWGATQVNINQVDAVQVIVIGTNITSVHDIVGGIADLTGLTIPHVGTDLRLRTVRAGTAAAVSEPFDLAP